MEELKHEVKQKLAEESRQHTSGRRELLRDRGPVKTYFHPDPKRKGKLKPVQLADAVDKRPHGVSARQWKREQKAERRRRVESWQEYRAAQSTCAQEPQS